MFQQVEAEVTKQAEVNQKAAREIVQLRRWLTVWEQSMAALEEQARTARAVSLVELQSLEENSDGDESVFFEEEAGGLGEYDEVEALAEEVEAEVVIGHGEPRPPRDSSQAPGQQCHEAVELVRRGRQMAVDLDAKQALLGQPFSGEPGRQVAEVAEAGRRDESVGLSGAGQLDRVQLGRAFERARTRVQQFLA
ncbi:unnamed protein product, partial [Protopolystoma xenopodis]